MEDKGEVKAQNILVTSLVASRDQSPRIDITFVDKDVRIQLSAEEARSFALNILGCANGAYCDAFIVNFLMEKVFNSGDPMDLQKATMVMADFRVFRDNLKKEFDSYQ